MRVRVPRISQRVDRVVSTTIAVVSSPIWVPAFACLVLLQWAHKLKRDVLGPTSSWERWYAWYPVSVPDFHINGLGSWRGTWVWLETIERRAEHHELPIDYRIINGDYS